MSRDECAAARGRKYEQRLAELSEGDAASLGMVVRRAVMLSMSLTGTLKHFDGSDAWTHDDYDVAMAAFNELVKRGVPAGTPAGSDSESDSCPGEGVSVEPRALPGATWLIEQIAPLAEKAEAGPLSFADVNRLHALVLDFALAVRKAPA